MRFLSLLPLFLLVACCSGSPDFPIDDLNLTSKFFKDSYVKYTADHDIVNIVAPLNKINFGGANDPGSEEITLFFVEADVNDKGEKDYKGLYIYEDGKATKILENGRYAAARNDDSKKVFLGASDGLYVYDGEGRNVTKIGLISDNIIQVEADNKTGIVYYLTENHDLYSVTDEGVKTNVETVKNAREIILDFLSNIYFHDANNDVYVFNADGLKKFKFFSTPSSIKLIRPMYTQDEGVFAVVDDYLYLLHSSGKADLTVLKLEVKPTAYAPEGILLQYYALDRKIYEFNIIEMLFANGNAEIPKL